MCWARYDSMYRYNNCTLKSLRPVSVVISFFPYFYRPHLMFLHLCVILCTAGWGGGSSVSVGGVCVQGGLCLGGLPQRPPPVPYGNVWAVRILLESILVLRGEGWVASPLGTLWPRHRKSLCKILRITAQIPH